VVVSVLLANAPHQRNQSLKYYLYNTAIIPISSSGTMSCASLPDATSVSPIMEAEYEPKDSMKKSRISSETRLNWIE